MKIVTFGGATQDVFLHYEDAQIAEFCSQHEKKSFLLLQEGVKIEIDKIRYSTGGGATNCAVSFKRLGFDVTTFFKIGADSQGMTILQTLKQEGISVQNCIIDHHRQTGISYIIPSLRGDRTVLAFRGANAHIVEQELPFDSFAGYTYAYITSLSGISSRLLLPLAQRAKKDGVKVVSNPGISQLKGDASLLCQSLPFIDILILNCDEAEQLMISLLQANQNTHFNLHHFFKEILTRGPQIIIITHGSEGVYVCSGSTVYFHPSLSVKVVSTLGAGDAFGSAFVAGLALFNSIEQAIRSGIINSMSVITHVDAKQGLLRRHELEEELQKLDPSLLQKIELL